MNSTFDLNRFYVMTGNSSTKKSFQMVGYKIENETIDDLLQPNYFEPIKDKLNKDDLILVLDLKKELDYKNIEFLIVNKKSLNEIVIKKLDLSGEFSKDLPLPTSDNGNIGLLTLLSRSDHQHPKAISTEEERGEIIIATSKETEIGKDNTKAITPNKLKQQTDKLKEEINQRIDEETQTLNETIINETNKLNDKINNDILNLKTEVNTRIDNETKILNNKIDEEIQKQEQLTKDTINNFINNLTPDTIRNYLMPDYTSAIDIKAELTTGYKAPEKGVICLSIGTISGGVIEINIFINDVNVGRNEVNNPTLVPFLNGEYIVDKDDIIKITQSGNYLNIITAIFCPFKNINNNNQGE